MAGNAGGAKVEPYVIPEKFKGFESEYDHYIQSLSEEQKLNLQTHFQINKIDQPLQTAHNGLIIFEVFIQLFIFGIFKHFLLIFPGHPKDFYVDSYEPSRWYFS